MTLRKRTVYRPGLFVAANIAVAIAGMAAVFAIDEKSVMLLWPAFFSLVYLSDQLWGARQELEGLQGRVRALETATRFLGAKEPPPGEGAAT